VQYDFDKEGDMLGRRVEVMGTVYDRVKGPRPCKRLTSK